MIKVRNYTCSVCGAEVEVNGIIDPEIKFNCDHQGNTVYANLEGTVFGESFTKQLLKLEQIPEEHRETFSQTMKERALVNQEGVSLWEYSVWVEYIEDWHKQQIAKDLLRRFKAK